MLGNSWLIGCRWLLPGRHESACSRPAPSCFFGFAHQDLHKFIPAQGLADTESSARPRVPPAAADTCRPLDTARPTSQGRCSRPRQKSRFISRHISEIEFRQQQAALFRISSWPRPWPPRRREQFFGVMHPVHSSGYPSSSDRLILKPGIWAGRPGFSQMFLEFVHI